MTRFVICTFYFNTNHAKPYTFSTPAKSETVLKPAILISLSRWPSPQLHQTFPSQGHQDCHIPELLFSGLCVLRKAQPALGTPAPGNLLGQSNNQSVPGPPGSPSPGPSTGEKPQLVQPGSFHPTIDSLVPKGPHFSVKTQRHRLRNNQSCQQFTRNS